MGFDLVVEDVDSVDLGEVGLDVGLVGSGTFWVGVGVRGSGEVGLDDSFGTGVGLVDLMPDVELVGEGRVGVVAAEGFGASQMHSVSPQSHSIHGVLLLVV